MWILVHANGHLYLATMIQVVLYWRSLSSALPSSPSIKTVLMITLTGTFVPARIGPVLAQCVSDYSLKIFFQQTYQEQLFQHVLNSDCLHAAWIHTLWLGRYEIWIRLPTQNETIPGSFCLPTYYSWIFLKDNISWMFFSCNGEPNHLTFALLQYLNQERMAGTSCKVILHFSQFSHTMLS